MQLKDRLARALEGRNERLPAEGLLPAAVLVPVIAADDGPRVLFIERAVHPRDSHSGQIAFPGGCWEPRDADYRATALRESEEEIGLPRDAVEVLGLLGSTVVPSGFSITPVVGWVPRLPELKPDVREVAAVFEVPVAELKAAGRAGARGTEYDAAGRRIWGATARIVGELLAHL